MEVEYPGELHGSGQLFEIDQTLLIFGTHATKIYKYDIIKKTCETFKEKDQDLKLDKD